MISSSEYFISALQFKSNSRANSLTIITPQKSAKWFLFFIKIVSDSCHVYIQITDDIFPRKANILKHCFYKWKKWLATIFWNVSDFEILLYAFSLNYAPCLFFSQAFLQYRVHQHILVSWRTNIWNTTIQ